MGSRRHHPGRRVEDHFARASSTLGPLGEGAQSVSRCKSRSQHVEGCAHPGTEIEVRIERLQAAISALGDADMAEKESLVKYLHHAQAQAVVPPVLEQIASTQGFIERERKRSAAAEEAVLLAVKNRDESLEALAQGEKRLEELQSQQRSPFAGPVDDAETEFARLRAQVASERYRTATHEGSGDAQFGSSRALSMDGRESQGFGGSCQHGRPQSGCRFEFHVDTGSRAHARDDRKETFRRRVPVSHSSWRGAVRTLLRVAHTSRCLARYGHRGTRVGEAAHPGPSRRLRRVGDERNVAPRLSTLATLVDSSVSDDEMPLLSGFTGPQDRDDVHDHGTIDPTLLDSLAEDLGATERDTIPARLADREVDECSSVGSESCWGEQEDIADDEVPEWGVPGVA